MSLFVIDNTSSLQVEAVALMGALAHVLLSAGHVVIHTDSRGAIDSLQHVSPSDNTFYLLTIVLTAQRILSLGKPHWHSGELT